eukprot:3409602-Prymnesium_polylepis.1
MWGAGFVGKRHPTVDLRDTRNPGKRLAAARAYYLDSFYRSLYALQYGQWLKTFDPKQLLVLPFNWAIANEGSTLELVSGFMHSVSDEALNISAPTDNAPVNERAHPTTDEAIDSVTQI